MPSRQPAMSNYEKGLLWANIGVAVATLLGVAAACWGVMTSLSKDSAERREADELQWQELEVYAVVERGSAGENARGLTVSDIAQQYATDAQRSDQVHLTKKKLQDQEVRRLLLGLLAQKLITQTTEDRYIVVRAAILPNALQNYSVNRAIGAILTVLATDSGKYTVSELQPVVMERAKISSEDYHIAINLLMAGGEIAAEKEGKLWSATHPAPADKQRKP